MIINIKKLIEIQKHVGHDCDVGVSPCMHNIKVIVCAELPDGEILYSSETFDNNRDLPIMIDRFKNRAKKEFDMKLESFNTIVKPDVPTPAGPIKNSTNIRDF